MLLVAAGLLFALGLVIIHAALTPAPMQITQKDIDAAVLHTLETVQMPSRAAKAYEAVRRSVVRVRGTTTDQREEGFKTAMKEEFSGIEVLETQFNENDANKAASLLQAPQV